MAQATRPGGLTALAVINFVLCGLAFFGILGLLFVLNVNPDDLKKDPPTQNQVRLMQANSGKTLALVGGQIAVVVFWLISGLGYLRQKKVMGRWIGTLAGVLSLATVAVQVSYLPFSLEHLSNVVYPLLTVVLINTTFRDDLVL